LLQHPPSILFPYTTLFRSVDAYSGNAGANTFPHHPVHRHDAAVTGVAVHDDRDRHAVGYPSGDRHALSHRGGADIRKAGIGTNQDRKSTRLNSSHLVISYA